MASRTSQLSGILRPKHQVVPVVGLLSRCQASGLVTLMDRDGFKACTESPPGQEDEMSVWSQGFQSCHVKTNWLPQHHQKWPKGVCVCVSMCVSVWLCVCMCVFLYRLHSENHTLHFQSEDICQTWFEGSGDGLGQD